MEDIDTLYREARQLLHLGDDESGICVDEYSTLSDKVQRLMEKLLNVTAASVEREARRCLALLMGYNGLIYIDTENGKRRKQVIKQAKRVLRKLSPSLLKCQLLTFCFGETNEKSLALEAHSIIDSWGEYTSDDEKKDIAFVLQLMEAYPRR